MDLFDTHCHIHTANFRLLSDEQTKSMWSKMDNPNPDAMRARAAQNGVSRMICVGCTLADSRQAVEFVKDREDCWASVGLHPHEAKDGQAALDGVAALLSGFGNTGLAKPEATHEKSGSFATRPDKIIAIGEIGLDYFYQHSDKTAQQKALRFQIELALAHNLPIIFHVREAFDDFWPIFDSYKNIRGVLHSYTDSYANFTEAMKRGLYIGINGITTFTKVTEQLQIAKEVPLQKLLLETDAPFLTPTPLRGTVNEPAHVRLVAKFLAYLRQETPQTIAAYTTQNALRLFTLN